MRKPIPKSRRVLLLVLGLILATSVGVLALEFGTYVFPGVGSFRDAVPALAVRLGLAVGLSLLASGTAGCKRRAEAQNNLFSLTSSRTRVLIRVRRVG